jgi:hypothetical protein
VKKIQMASEEDIAAVIGASKAKALLATLEKNKASN